MRPEFYCLKYKGLLSPAKILEDSSQIGWKCRKYQRWKQIHTGDGDKEFLSETGDSLIENGKFDIKSYRKFSEIFFNVQRWRYDKENLLQDPPHRPEWDEIEQLILLGDESKSLLKRRLGEIGLPDIDVRADVAHAFVTMLGFFRLAEAVGLRVIEHGGGLVDDMSNTGPIDACTVFEIVRPPLAELYVSVGLQPPEGSELFSVLAAVCIDLGFSTYPEVEPELLGEIGTDDAHQSVVVRLDNLDRARLFSVDLVRGVVVVTANRNHPFVSENLTDEAATRRLAKLALAYGVAANDMFGSAQQITAFTSYLGLALAKPTDKKAIDQFVHQALSLGSTEQ
jgi:hypothetical protein